MLVAVSYHLSRCTSDPSVFWYAVFAVLFYSFIWSHVYIWYLNFKNSLRLLIGSCILTSTLDLELKSRVLHNIYLNLLNNFILKGNFPIKDLENGHQRWRRWSIARKTTKNCGMSESFCILWGNEYINPFAHLGTWSSYAWQSFPKPHFLSSFTKLILPPCFSFPDAPLKSRISFLLFSQLKRLGNDVIVSTGIIIVVFAVHVSTMFTLLQVISILQRFSLPNLVQLSFTLKVDWHQLLFTLTLVFTDFRVMGSYFYLFFQKG